MNENALPEKYNQENFEVILDIVTQINSAIGLDDLLNRIIETTKNFFQVEACSLLFIDPKSNELYFRNLISRAKEKVKEIRVPMTKGIAGMVARSGKPVIVNDPSDPRIYKEVDRKSNMTTRNLCCVPLKVKNQITGVLEIMNSLERNAFTKAELEMLGVFAEFVAIAINNRELLDNSGLQVKQLSSIYKIAQIVNHSDDTKDLIRETLNIIRQQTGGERVSIILKDEKGRFRFKGGLHIASDVLVNGQVTLENNVLQHVLEKQETILCYNIDEDERFGRNKNLRYKSKSFCCVPCFYQDELIGFFSVTEPNSENFFNWRDKIFIETIVTEFAQGYHLMNIKCQAREKEYMDTEVKITARIQEEVLPSEFPSITGMSFAAACLNAKIVGGDFYDVIKKSKDELVCLISDISGKGIPSTVFMSVVRSILRMNIHERKTLKSVVTGANRYIYENSRSGMFATTFLVNLQPSQKKFTWINAGHFPQMFFNSKLKKVQLLHSESKPFGIVETQKFTEKSQTYSSGDRLVLFTDGIIEAHDQNHQEFGLDRLSERVEQSLALSAEELKETILQDVQSFTKSRELSDDLTLMIIDL